MQRQDLVREPTRRGVLTRTSALRGVAVHVLDDALADGALVRLYPEVYTVPARRQTFAPDVVALWPTSPPVRRFMSRPIAQCRSASGRLLPIIAGADSVLTRRSRMELWRSSACSATRAFPCRGARYGEPGQRERDLLRDAALAALGIQTVRYSHPRVFGQPDSVLRQTLEILAVRRLQLDSSAAS